MCHSVCLTHLPDGARKEWEDFKTDTSVVGIVAIRLPENTADQCFFCRPETVYAAFAYEPLRASRVAMVYPRI